MVTVLLNHREIMFLVQYLNIKIDCYQRLGFHMDEIQDKDYLLCSDLRTKLINAANGDSYL